MKSPQQHLNAAVIRIERWRARAAAALILITFAGLVAVAASAGR